MELKIHTLSFNGPVLKNRTLVSLFYKKASQGIVETTSCWGSIFFLISYVGESKRGQGHRTPSKWHDFCKSKLCLACCKSLRRWICIWVEGRPWREWLTALHLPTDALLQCLAGWTTHGFQTTSNCSRNAPKVTPLKMPLIGFHLMDYFSKMELSGDRGSLVMNREPA